MEELAWDSWIDEYQSAIPPILARIAQLDREIATTPRSTKRDKLIQRRIGLIRMVREKQQDIVDMKDREVIQCQADHYTPAENPDAGS